MDNREQVTAQTKSVFFQIGVTDIVLLVISALFLIGIVTIFAPCGPKDDGSFMTCHWAGRAIAGNAAVLTVLSLIHMFVPDRKMKMGISCSMIPSAVLTAIIPGNLIGLCMMDNMHCRAVMRPAAVVMSVLIVLVSGLDFYVQNKKREK